MLAFCGIRNCVLWHVLSGAILAQGGQGTVLSASHVFIFLLQLLSQLENHGPPPADRDTIQNLPTISVTAEHVGKLSLSHNPFFSGFFFIFYEHVISLEFILVFLKV